MSASKDRKPGLSYKARKRWTLVILLVGLPAYIMLSVSVISWFERPSLVLEFCVYLALGILWALPFKFIFRGVGVADPDAQD